jgi:hypothetical protein
MERLSERILIARQVLSTFKVIGWEGKRVTCGTRRGYPEI